MRVKAIVILIGSLAVAWTGGCVSRPAERHGGHRFDPAAQARALDLLDAASSDADELWIIERSAGPTSPLITMMQPHREHASDAEMILRSDDGAIARAAADHSAVHVVIQGDTATVKLSQAFTNPLATPARAEYRLHLPAESTVSDFLLSIGDRRIRGIIRERKEAEFLYDEAWKQGYTASRLTLDPDGSLLAHIANIPGGAAIGVDVSYRHWLAGEGPSFRWVAPVPLTDTSSLGIEIEASGAIRDVNVSHRTAVHRPGGDKRRLNLALSHSDAAHADADQFTLTYTVVGAAARCEPASNPAGTGELDRRALREGLLVPGAAFIAVDALRKVEPREIIASDKPATSNP